MQGVAEGEGGFMSDEELNRLNRKLDYITKQVDRLDTVTTLTFWVIIITVVWKGCV